MRTSADVSCRVPHEFITAMPELPQILDSLTFDGDVMDAVGRRVSVRTFTGQDLGESQIEVLQAGLKEVSRVCGASVTAAIVLCGMSTTVTFSIGGDEAEVTLQADTTNSGLFKPSTYGVISGAAGYMLLGFDASDRNACFAAGAAAEVFVLRATEAGIGTCWLGGTFRHASFAGAFTPAAGQKLNAVIAFGIPAQKKRLIERFERWTTGADTRKPFDELFTADPGCDLTPYTAALQAMRLAPSAVNVQPWRARLTAAGLKFYSTEPSPKFMIDMGIALGHFQLAARAQGLNCRWTAGSGQRQDKLTHVATCKAAF